MTWCLHPVSEKRKGLSDEMKKSILVLVLMAGSPLLADSAVMFEFPDGRSVALTSSGDVSMAAESVTITPARGFFDPWDSGDEFLPLMRVRCVFELVNESEEPQDVSVGFPIDARFGDAYSVLPDSMLVAIRDSQNADENWPNWFKATPAGDPDVLEELPPDLDFTASADGEQLEVFYRRCNYSLEDQLVHQPLVAVWRMHFEPGQRVRLVNAYNTSWDYLGGGTWSDYSISYILTTGSTWSGSIGRGVITLTVPKYFPFPHLSDTVQVCWDWTGSPRIEGRNVIWEFRDLEPSENLEFYVREMGISNIYGNYSPTGLLESLSTGGDDVLYTASRYISDNNDWGQTFHPELVLRILEVSHAFLSGEKIPYPDLLHLIYHSGYSSLQGDSVRLSEIRYLLENVRTDLDEDLDLVEQAGYDLFIPLFTRKYQWDSDDIDMFAAQPDLEPAYLEILSHLEEACRGEEIADPAIEAFYKLTGWYRPGESRYYCPELSEDLAAYVNRD